MKKRFICLFLMGLLTGEVVANESKLVYGYVEKVILLDKNITLSAKLDTGAKTASLSAIRIKEVNEKGKTFLIFTVPTKLGDYQFKAEYAGRVRIKPRTGEYKKVPVAFKRPMVKLKIKLGNRERLITFNLTNRKRFNYPVLLGRDALVAFDGVVDPSSAFLIKKGLNFQVVDSHDKE
jgi:hypothetical protein